MLMLEAEWFVALLDFGKQEDGTWRGLDISIRLDSWCSREGSDGNNVHADHVPGTSSVSRSLSIPMAHFLGLTLWASRSEEDVWALVSERFGALMRFLNLDMASLWDGRAQVFEHYECLKGGWDVSTQASMGTRRAV